MLARWNPRFFEADARFWPLEPAALRFAEHADWPAPEEHRAPGVSFVAASKPRRSRRRSAGPGYDACVVGGVVPTRPRSWHDFLNALVWSTFPESKRRLHARQAAAIRAATVPGSRALPNARSREHDALALLDEGGLLVLQNPRETLLLAFGHALYEGLVVGGPPATASALCFELDALPPRAVAASVADRLLSERLAGALSPESLARRAF